MPKKTKRDNPYIIYDGYSFSLPNIQNLNRDKVIWQCTNNQKDCAKDQRPKRCTATIVTRIIIIDGYRMLRPRQTNHICDSRLKYYNE